jgi:hypothetical protein
MALTGAQRTTLLALMIQAGPAPLAFLTNTVKISLAREKREELAKQDLITVTGKPMVLELTERGWATAKQEFEAELPPRAGAFGGTLYLLLGFLNKYLETHQLSAAQFFASTAPAETIPAADLEDQIRKAYDELAAAPGAYLMLADLRAALPGADRASVDAALLRMDLAKSIILIPESNQKVLTAGQRGAAIRINNQNMHLLAVTSG